MPALDAEAMRGVVAACERTGLPFRRVPRLDEVVWLIPGHCDPTVNLHNHLVAVTGGLEHGRVEKIIRVDARGALT